MGEFLRIFIAYFKGKIFAIASGIVPLIVFIVVLWLYELPIEPIVYGVLLITAIFFIIGSVDFLYFYKRHLNLEKLKTYVGLADFKFPHTGNLIERDYQQLIKEIDRNRLNIINEKNKSYSDMIDYYTIWAHQIKTPIAAMRLILQSEKSEINDELLEQLFKTEQYVEMVLQYLRLESLNSDLLFKEYALDNIIKQAVRKYSKLFIRKKIKLNYEDVNTYVLTDEKWLVFVVEQILSNSLKYTNKGEISIYMDENMPDTLVIEDTGIGIELEDLPRVFEKGFTGYNGRSDKKSTGIGLYLCKQILNKLSHSIRIESMVGKGTSVIINLHRNNINFE